LGSGTALPSILAQKFTDSSHIIITDNFSHNFELHNLITRSLKANKVLYFDKVTESKDHEKPSAETKVVVENLNWCFYTLDWIKSLEAIDCLIGSDVFFDSGCKLNLS
jgi:hypothetical protein